MPKLQFRYLYDAFLHKQKMENNAETLEKNEKNVKKKKIYKKLK